MMMQNPCVQIDDPLNTHNNVGKSSFKFYEIKVVTMVLTFSHFRWPLTMLREFSSWGVSASAITRWSKLRTNREAPRR